MLRQIKTFLALRALGYSPREAKRILDIARRSRLEFEDCHGKGSVRSFKWFWGAKEKWFFSVLAVDGLELIGIISLSQGVHDAPKR